jgi:hypothetical protein
MQQPSLFNSSNSQTNASIFNFATSVQPSAQHSTQLPLQSQSFSFGLAANKTEAAIKPFQFNIGEQNKNPLQTVDLKPTASTSNLFNFAAKPMQSQQQANQAQLSHSQIAQLQSQPQLFNLLQSKPIQQNTSLAIPQQLSTVEQTKPLQQEAINLTKSLQSVSSNSQLGSLQQSQQQQQQQQQQRQQQQFFQMQTLNQPNSQALIQTPTLNMPAQLMAIKQPQQQQDQIQIKTTQLLPKPTQITSNETAVKLKQFQLELDEFKSNVTKLFGGKDLAKHLLDLSVIKKAKTSEEAFLKLDKDIKVF